MINKIIKAINEGVKQGLLQFDSDQISFNKSKTSSNILKYLQDYKLGDFVYYDEKLGYNNTTGEKVAICVDEHKSLFAVLNHPLLVSEQCWAIRGTKLHDDQIPEFDNGYANTKYILENYSDELKGTIWECLEVNEYIPSIFELEKIANNCKNNKLLLEVLNFIPDAYAYWSSSLSEDNAQEAYYFISYHGCPNPYYEEKNTKYYHSLVLISLD